MMIRNDKDIHTLTAVRYEIIKENVNLHVFYSAFHKHYIPILLLFLYIFSLKIHEKLRKI